MSGDELARTADPEGPDEPTEHWVPLFGFTIGGGLTCDTCPVCRGAFWAGPDCGCPICEPPIDQGWQE